jgi:pyruvate formate lyase activating enzyme
VEVAKACRERGIKTVAVTAGYVEPAAGEEFFAHMDAANVDLKAFTEDFYRNLCGGHLQPVLDTLVHLKKDTKVWFEITTLLIPGANDSDAEIDALSRWVAESLGPDVPLHFSAFHPAWKMSDLPRTDSSTLSRARSIALGNGLRHVYTGNVHDANGGSTWCHACGGLLIGRDWYELSAWNLTPDGACRTCGTKLAGVFDGPPGTWGCKRQPVRMMRA